MVTHIWRRRRTETMRAEAAPAEPERKRSLLGRRTDPTGPKEVLTRQRPVEAVPQTVLVDRRTARRWRGRAHNPVSLVVWIAAWAAVLILLLGIVLTWANANPANDIVHQILRAGNWLATPFHDAFLNPDPKHRLYADWGVAAAVYLVIGRVLSWLIRW
ncbi:MAG TPA: hypothetical protein VH912_13940 [Streptosporangiaceae bacterium]|jgi:hypothetical protein